MLIEILRKTPSWTDTDTVMGEKLFYLSHLDIHASTSGSKLLEFMVVQ